MLMSDESRASEISRREMLETVGKAAVATVMLPTVLHGLVGEPIALAAAGQAPALAAEAGVDRIAVLPGRTYLNGWTGYGERPRPPRPRRPGRAR
jgi:hypothetical protein